MFSSLVLQSESNSSASAKFTLFKCVYCAQVLGLNDRPKLLECLHVACGQCVNTKFSELDRSLPPLIHCPVCDNASQNEYIANKFAMKCETALKGFAMPDGNVITFIKITSIINALIQRQTSCSHIPSCQHISSASCHCCCC